jgi:hypothetical protein
MISGLIAGMEQQMQGKPGNLPGELMPSLHTGSKIFDCFRYPLRKTTS